jgi:hypothetical protein
MSRHGNAANFACMKAYLVTTGAIFGAIAVLHLLRAIQERDLFASRSAYFLSMAALGMVAALLSGWAFFLVRRRRGQS